MTLVDRLKLWEERGTLSTEQRKLLDDRAHGEPVSVSLELSILLYVGVLAFVGGLGWTVSTWSEQLGDVLVVTVLSALFVGSLWYCFSRGPKWSPNETASPNLYFDYVLYFASLVWSVELTYIENRFHLLSGQWDFYLALSAALFFFLAYRFDNRLVLSLALSSLAGWFGISISRWHPNQDEEFRLYGILYSFTIAGAGWILERRGLKPHFLTTYLNLAANVLFWAILSGVFDTQAYLLWFLGLLAACGAALAWGLTQRQFSFVAYAAVYGYVGVSSILLRHMRDGILVMMYFLFTGIAMLVLLIKLGRKFGRQS